MYILINAHLLKSLLCVNWILNNSQSFVLENGKFSLQQVVHLKPYFYMERHCQWGLQAALLQVKLEYWHHTRTSMRHEGQQIQVLRCLEAMAKSHLNVFRNGKGMPNWSLDTGADYPWCMCGCKEKWNCEKKLLRDKTISQILFADHAENQKKSECVFYTSQFFGITSLWEGQWSTLY